MKNKVWIAVIAFVALVVGWAAFRPELLFVNKTVNESLPVTAASAQGEGPMELAMGRFHDVAHETKGNASLYQLPEGKRVLRLTNFETSNGPDVRVFLIGAKDAKDNAAVKREGFVELGSLKGNKGDQNYDIPADVDLSKYNAVTIWCNRFSVNFGTAPLMRSEAKPTGPVARAMGNFHSVAHETKGDATIYELPEGKRVLRLTNFETSNGPDVRVFLIGAKDAKDNAAVKREGFVELGSLKGNKGDQNYDIPADVDLSKYNAVTIWCNRFSVNFATAPLSKQG